MSDIGTPAGGRTVLAVDAGNSKIDVALVTEEGRVLARGRGGPFQPQSAGVAAAVDALDEAVRRALGEHGPPSRPYADHVAAYCAGADLPVEEEALRRELLARGYAPGVVVGNDTFALLRAGASGPWGVAVVCGAGINAVGVSPTGAVARFPALGALSGDWGGGLTLGREALWHAVRAEDGRGPATALAGAVTDCFGARTVEEVVLALHFGEVPMDRLNDLSPWVFRVAAGGDATAVALVLRLAEEVTLFAEVAMRRLDLLDTPTEVVLGGGVLAAADPLLIGRIGELLALRAPQAKPLITGTPPIVGAALLGLDHLGAGEKAAEAVRAALSPGDRP